MTPAVHPSQLPEGRVTHKREALSEAVLIRVSYRLDVVTYASAA